ncbi:hypothetical protein GUJ93_ZPchr0010g10890 [Zizania palustris]|uniref:Uncharacterized protein n=1 Tax=Zizania palustris TaxID=103762 RepID=A0A8J5W7B8_ZIZPA|nr:hypothetical protein GUJ93_ZPchr0010g10890 [Zizania palustris]
MKTTAAGCNNFGNGKSGHRHTRGWANKLRFQSYDDTGFKINNLKYEGSLLIVENKIMTWTPKTFVEITAESLSIFKVMHPIPGNSVVGQHFVVVCGISS